MGESAVLLGNQWVPVWPEGQTIEALGHPSIMTTRFTDTDRYHMRLITRILEMASRPRTGKQYFRGAGGSKVHHVERWSCSEANLIHARALEFFRRALQRENAVADISWANVYRDGEYCMPHSHLRSTASIVYFVDQGEPDPGDPLNGDFYIADPRVPACCEVEPDKMTTPIVPGTKPGTMIIFPSQVVHCVNPYRGARPRITMSWNVNETTLLGSPLPDE